MLGCCVLSTNPTVMAEMVFEKKEGADNVIAQFNNQRADGRLLHIYFKVPNVPSAETMAPRPKLQTSQSSSALQPSMTDPFSAPAPAQRRAEPDVQDGRYGFDRRRDDANDRHYSGRRYDDRYAPRERGRDSRSGRQDEAIDVDMVDEGEVLAAAPAASAALNSSSGQAGGPIPTGPSRRDEGRRYDDRRRNEYPRDDMRGAGNRGDRGLYSDDMIRGGSGGPGGPAARRGRGFR